MKLTVKRPSKPWTEMNKEELRAEFLKCKKDKAYFIANYIKVEHQLLGLVPFDLFPFQVKIIENLEKFRFNILRKFRQAGCTTIACAYALHVIIFEKNKTVAILSMGDVESTESLTRVRIMYDELPTFLKPPIAHGGDNKHNLELETGSKIKARPAKKTSGRSLSASLLILDEAAFIENVQDIWTAAAPTISCVTKDTIILTNKGFKKISDLIPKDKNPGDYFSLDTDLIYGKNGLEPISHGYISPKSITIKIKTQKGLTLECTENHPLYTLTSSIGQMTKSKDLSLGDFLRVDHSMGVFGINAISLDDAYMLGGFIAEGWIRTKTKTNGGYSVWISNSDEDFRNIYLRNGFRITKNKQKLCIGGKAAVEKYQFYGVDPFWKAWTKEVPSFILESTKEVQCKFLQGLFDGDGCCMDNGSIILTSTSKKLINQVQLMMLNLGIIPRIIFKSAEQVMKESKDRILPGGKSLQSCHDVYQLIINRSQNSLFRATIGFNIKRKQDILIHNCLKYSQEDFKLKTIPISKIKNTILEIINKIDKPKNWFRAKGLRLDKMLDSKPDRLCNTYWLSKFETIVKNYSPSLYHNYRSFFLEFIRASFWDKIVSIEYGEDITYDFTVPGTHSFLQNGILGSNTGGRVFILSTVNGMGNFFYNMWDEAINGLNEFNPVDIVWTEHPQYKYNSDYEDLYAQLKTKDPNYDVNTFESTMRRNLGIKRFRQEFLCEFLGTGETYIDGETLTLLHENSVKEKYSKYNGKLKIWSEPTVYCQYVLGADVALGREKDYSAFQVINSYDGEQVAEFYSNKIPIDEFAKIIAETGKIYNNALVMPERNTIGNNLIDTLLRKEEYENLWMDKKGLFGFQTTQQTRAQMMAMLEDYLRTKKIKINSERTVKELLTFIIDDAGKPVADEGQHDDLVTSLALACFALNELLINNPGTISKLNGSDTYDPLEISINNKNNLRRPEYGGRSYDDIKWVLGK